MTDVGLSVEALERVRSVMVSHVARCYASGVVALVGDGEASQVLTVGAKVGWSIDPVHSRIIF